MIEQTLLGTFGVLVGLALVWYAYARNRSRNQSNRYAVLYAPINRKRRKRQS